MEEVEELLGKTSENPLYLQLAQQQSVELQHQLLVFGVELSKHHNEALATAMSLHPIFEYNTADEMAKLADSLTKRHKQYTDKHTKCIKSLGDLQSRIGLLITAEAPTPSRHQGGQADRAEPRYVHREGSASRLPDNVDPAGMV